LRDSEVVQSLSCSDDLGLLLETSNLVEAIGQWSWLLMSLRQWVPFGLCVCGTALLLLRVEPRRGTGDVCFSTLPCSASRPSVEDAARQLERSVAPTQRMPAASQSDLAFPT